MAALSSFLAPNWNRTSPLSALRMSILPPSGAAGHFFLENFAAIVTESVMEVGRNLGVSAKCKRSHNLSLYLKLYVSNAGRVDVSAERGEAGDFLQPLDHPLWDEGGRGCNFKEDF